VREVDRRDAERLHAVEDVALDAAKAAGSGQFAAGFRARGRERRRDEIVRGTVDRLEQLAEVFDVEAATIGSRLFRARRALQDGLERPDLGGKSGSGTPEALDAWARNLANDRPPEK